MMNAVTNAAVDTLPLEGRDQGWGFRSISTPVTQFDLQNPLPNPPLKGEGADRGETSK